MNATDYYGWVPPTVAEANFSNCKAAAQWLTASLNTQVQYDSMVNTEPIGPTLDYITSLVPSGMDTPTVGQAMQWYEDLDGESTMFLAMSDFPIFNCSSDVCQTLAWSGDSDLAGIGVIIVYYLAAALATTYFVLLAIDRRPPFQPESWLARRWNTFIGAFRESISTFLDAALLFSISMLIAGTYRQASARIHPDKTHSVYALTNSTYMGIFTVFPPLLLQIAAREIRRHRIRLLLWLLVLVFAVTNVSLYYTLTQSSRRLSDLLGRSSASADALWEINCEPFGLRDAIDYALIAAETLLCLNCSWLAYHLLPSALRARLLACVGRADRHRRAWDAVLRVVGLVDGCLCGAAMWALLGLFTGYRIAVEQRMGSNDSDTQWSFGQVLGLATWAPVAIDLITIYIYGAPKALGGKVSQRYRVVEMVVVEESVYVEPETGEGSMVQFRRPHESMSTTYLPGYVQMVPGGATSDKQHGPARDGL